MSSPFSQHRKAFVIFCRNSVNPDFSKVIQDIQLIFQQALQPLLIIKSSQNQREYLGQSLSHTLIDCRDGIDYDSLCCVIAAIQGGSCLILIFNERPVLPFKTDQMLAVDTHSHLQTNLQVTHRAYFRFISHIKTYMNCLSEDQISQLSNELNLNQNSIINHESIQNPFKADQIPQIDQLIQHYAVHPQQAQIIHKIYEAFKGNAKKQIALIAHRGRGKSASLGIAIALLIYSGEPLIYLSAMDIHQVQTVIFHVKRVLQDLNIHQDHQKMVFVPSSTLLFLNQEQTSKSNQKIKLMIDEASTIDLSILEKVNAHQILYASTIGGYEGKARNLALRFLPTLKKLERYTLDTPIRWANHDPIEALMSRFILMDAEIYDQNISNQDQSISNHFNLTQVRYQRLNRDSLVEDEQKLQACFSLLMQAHYQTTANDLWRMLDAPNLLIDILENHDSQILAIALIAKEGGLDDETQDLLYRDRFRPRGQVLPSNFAVHLASPDLSKLQMWRVVRIAVLPQYQGRSLGSYLMQHITENAKKEGISIIGALFSATPKVMRFWHKQGFEAIRFSLRPNENSSSYSVLMIHVLSENTNQSSIQKLENLQSQSIHRFIHQLSETEQVLPLGLIFSYLQSSSSLEMAFQTAINQLKSLSRHDWDFLIATAYLGRSYELNVYASFKLALCWLLDPHRSKIEPEIYAQFLTAKVIQKRSLQTIIQDLQVPISRLVMKGISCVYQRLIEDYAPVEVLEMVRKIK